MAEKLCETCRFWERPDDWQANILGVRRCAYVVELWNATKWDTVNERTVPVDAYPDQKAFAQDGSSYRADLYTKPDFGCVAHQETHAAGGRDE